MSYPASKSLYLSNFSHYFFLKCIKNNKKLWKKKYFKLKIFTGSVAAASSPIHESSHNFVNVEFDDGDSGRIHVDDIRLLPAEFPIIGIVINYQFFYFKKIGWK